MPQLLHLMPFLSHRSTENVFPQLVLGNDYEFIGGEKLISIILFHFSEDNSRLTVFKKNNNFNKRFSEVREALQEKKDL